MGKTTAAAALAGATNVAEFPEACGLAGRPNLSDEGKVTAA
jgi:hypothetical protein